MLSGGTAHMVVRAISAAAALALLTLALGACGSSKKTGATTGTAAAASTTSTTSTTAKKVHVMLDAPDHHPIAGKLWPFTVTATDANGHGLRGTVDVEFTFQGIVVGTDKPKTHQLSNGRWHENLTYPARAIGQPIDLQLVVHTPIGTKTITWAIDVRR